MKLTESSWIDLLEQAPELAAFGKARLDGKVAYMATVRSDGSPRVFPITPVITDRHCYIFADPRSSKTRDLARLPGFSLHCGMSDSSGSSGEFQVRGRLVEELNPSAREAAEAVCSYRPSASYLMFELRLSEAIGTEYRGGRPVRSKWQMITEQSPT